MYSKQDFLNNLQGNFYGGITAAVIALPLALAFGIATGLGPIAGLYGAGIVGLFAAVFGGTPTQVSGPTGPMTVVMTSLVTQFMASNPENGLALAFTSVMLGGIFQIVLGILKFGRFIIMVPYSVISGFMSGIGAIIIILQLAPILGFDGSGNVAEAILHLEDQLDNINLIPLGIGLLSLLIVFIWQGKLNKIIPGAIVALIICSTVSHFGFHDSAKVIGEIPSALPNIQIPTLDISSLRDVIMGAIMLALLGAIDSLLTSLIADNVTGTEHDSNRELIGQGIGNTLAGLIGGLPGAGATMRTMVNIRAGATGPLSGVIHSLTLLAITLGLGFLFEHIPLAALSGILIKVGIDIIDWPFIKRLHKMPRFPVFLMLLVFFLTVWVDLISAVLIGVFIKNMVILEKLSELQLGSVLLTDSCDDQYQLEPEIKKRLYELNGRGVLLKINGPLSYGAGRSLKKLLHAYEDKSVMLIDLSHASLIGLSTALMIEDIVKRARLHDMEVTFVGISLQVQNDLKTLGLI